MSTNKLMVLVTAKLIREKMPEQQKRGRSCKLSIPTYRFPSVWTSRGKRERET